MDKQKEMVLVDKEVIEKLFEILEDMQERLEGIEDDLYETKQTAFGIAEKLHAL